MRKYNWETVQEFYNKGNSIKLCCEYFGMHNSSFMKAVKRGDIKTRSHKESMEIASKMGRCKGGEWTEERRKEQSERKKRLYKEHPEKHPNFKCANNKKMMSYPEKLAYTFLEVNKIKFEHQKNILCYWVDFLVMKPV
jgi:hypothetical protein